MIRRIHFCVFALAVLLLLPWVAMAEPAVDGPYVMPTVDGGWVARWAVVEGDQMHARRRMIAPGTPLRVEAVGDVPAFEVNLRPPAPTGHDALNVDSTVPLFVVADIHGEYDILVELLQHQGIIDQQLHWAYGAGQLVFLGDVFDRGAHQVEVLWLIYQLQGEARQAGGGVEFLLGNHELMALRADARYLNERYAATTKTLEVASYAELFDARSVLGQWLRSRASVLRAGDVLLLHGGMSAQVVEQGLTVAGLNRLVREVLAGSADPDSSPLHDFAIRSNGPLWYRGYFPRDGQAPAAGMQDVDTVREAFGVRTVFVGHTALDAVTPLYDGRVVAVQVYPERDPDTGIAVIGAVRREGGQWYKAAVDGRRELLPVAVPLPRRPRARDVQQ